jgi:GGDEF domain-containing protein
MKSLAFFAPDGSGPPAIVVRFCEDQNLRLKTVGERDEVVALLNRAYPACLVVDGREEGEAAMDLCRNLKMDPFTSLVPVIILAPPEEGHIPVEGLAAGADEVVVSGTSSEEALLRLELVLRRADRDVSVHPTTRLPGTVQIERDLQERMNMGQQFAVCYADLDHFKEFNDRYGYPQGDRVILFLSRILRDVVRGLAPGGFVGHIGGDDFIFNCPLEHLERTCDEIVQLFDELIPYQYTEEDRRAGYFLGKDRRGAVHRVPLMSLSIGVVTNQFQHFVHTAQVGELAAEMKSFAKTLPGSVYVVDRRQAGAPPTSEAPASDPLSAAAHSTRR